MPNEQVLFGNRVEQPKRMRIVIEVNIPARGFSRERFNQQVVDTVANKLKLGGETVYLTTEEV